MGKLCMIRRSRSAGEGTAVETATASYDARYEIPANLAAIAGNYRGLPGHLLDSNSTTMSVDPDGKIGIAQAGCGLVGSATPRGSTAVFDLTVRTTSGVCLGGVGRSASGILAYDTSTGQIRIRAPFLRDDMFFVVGARQ